MIELVCGILGRDPEEVLIRIGALVIVYRAIALSAVLAKNVRWNVKYLAVLFDFCGDLCGRISTCEDGSGEGALSDFLCYSFSVVRVQRSERLCEFNDIFHQQSKADSSICGRVSAL